MEADFNRKITNLKVDGGASANNFLMGFQADISNLKVIRPKILEATALGAAFLAGLATNFFKDRNEIISIMKEDKCFEPTISKETREEKISNWKKAISSCRLYK